MESPTPSLDQILRDALAPSAATVERLVQTALEPPPRWAGGRWVAGFATVTAAVALVVWAPWRPPAPTPRQAAVQIVSCGSLVMAIYPDHATVLSGAAKEVPHAESSETTLVTATFIVMIQGEVR